ncbi:unnamed protein product [Tilletia controversa]|uniref:Uncharacterized protein n=3 Tax=Tilletia TaxID=13289 RepID=A0A8X7MTD7_9BASI|nr:hypothetical protein CF328_g4749 [Tilletia controversa]KAE8258114.1 hypothetical protein A4X03_0g4474 [Tilletia caries]CAD6954108.1 unnamed protein product [Tilletia laevis]KAE8247825.1 hypothetical protein A4X06_0g4160 [Tilletia controversa]CAD6892130.1 unnamed protein product [Tilletia caries]
MAFDSTSTSTSKVSRASGQSATTRRRRVFWTTRQERSLAQLLRDNPAFQATLLQIWFPSAQSTSASSSNNDARRGLSTRRLGVKSTLQAIIVQIFGNGPAKTPQQVRSKLRTMYRRYLAERNKMYPTAQQMLLREMDGYEGEIGRWKRQRYRVLLECQWWEIAHQIMIARERASQRPTSHTSTSAVTIDTVEGGSSEQGQRRSANVQWAENATGQEEDELDDDEEEDGEKPESDIIPHQQGIFVSMQSGRDEEAPEEGTTDSIEEDESEGDSSSSVMSTSSDSSIVFISARRSDDTMDVDSPTTESANNDLDGNNGQVWAGPSVTSPSNDPRQHQLPSVDTTNATSPTNSTHALLKSVKRLPKLGKYRSSRQLNVAVSSRTLKEQQTRLLIEQERTKRLKLKLEARAQEREQWLQPVMARMNVLEAQVKMTNEEMQRTLLQHVDRTLWTARSFSALLPNHANN